MLDGRTDRLMGQSDYYIPPYWGRKKMHDRQRVKPVENGRGLIRHLMKDQYTE
ncbi:hypothetical protein DPMN_046673 [Dreissena polymorpha]|uniref:Uncharacterized protein n=1 Tax=Dreissena polymorpha TaxID=45954 RepID=A0A9D4D6C1_DREPO|nr:hypothetical protein DPMN_046673 [Dreissena polymorpha]